MRAIVRKIRKFFGLSGEERRCLILAWWGLLAIDLALRIRPSWVMADPDPSAPRETSTDGPRAAEIAVCHRAVQRAAHHHLLPMTCLRRALCLRWLLARRGLPTRLRIGVQHDAGPLEAHAWLEDGMGEVVGEPAARGTGYAVLEKI